MSKEVLIVEDNRTLAAMLAQAVGAAGYPVHLVYDGEAALSRIRRKRPGLVLLDILLPKKDGRTVLQDLRARRETLDLPVVMISGVFKSSTQAKEFEQLGAQGFIAKPIARSTLVGKLKEILGAPPTDEEAVEGKDALSLSTTPAIEALWGAIERGITGGFHFRAGRKHKIVFFREGRPVAVRSNMVRECLGQRLLAAGRISRAAMEESVRRARAGEGRQGDLLVKMKAVTREDVDDALRVQGEEKLFELFGWTEGVVYFEEGGGAPSGGTDIEIEPVEVILRGVGHMSPESIERGLAPLRGETLEIDPSQLGRKASELPDVMALCQALRRAGGSADALIGTHAPLLYALHVAGAARPVADTQTEVDTPSEGSMPTGPAAREELEQVRDAQAGQNHFEVLGLAEDAGADDVKKAFFRLAKRFHPDRFGGQDAEIRHLAGEVFARMSVAHEVLVDNEARKKYLDQIHSGGDGRSAQEVSQILTAELEFQKGEVLLKKRDYARALERFRWAVELNPEEGEFRALYGWATYLQNPNDAKTVDAARESLEEAMELAPNAPAVYYYMGRLLKACGDLAGAETMFRKAVERQPDHVEANQELRLFRMRRGRGDEEPRKGRFGFGRKKD